eukprot:COSAG02_NODE_47976_length_337_cov_0.852941_1_plen_67_part_01
MRNNRSGSDSRWSEGCTAFISESSVLATSPTQRRLRLVEEQEEEAREFTLLEISRRFRSGSHSQNQN